MKSWSHQLICKKPWIVSEYFRRVANLECHTCGWRQPIGRLHLPPILGESKRHSRTAAALVPWPWASRPLSPFCRGCLWQMACFLHCVCRLQNNCRPLTGWWSGMAIAIGARQSKLTYRPEKSRLCLPQHAPLQTNSSRRTHWEPTLDSMKVPLLECYRQSMAWLNPTMQTDCSSQLRLHR